MALPLIPFAAGAAIGSLFAYGATDKTVREHIVHGAQGIAAGAETLYKTTAEGAVVAYEKAQEATVVAYDKAQEIIEQERSRSAGEQLLRANFRTVSAENARLRAQVLQLKDEVYELNDEKHQLKKTLVRVFELALTPDPAGF